MKTVHLAGLAFTVTDDHLVITNEHGDESWETPVADALIRISEIAAVLRYSTIEEDE